MIKESYRCWAEIDRSALRRNVAFLREKFGPEVEFLAVVKANAYGHGIDHSIAQLQQLFLLRFGESVKSPRFMVVTKNFCR